jgi:hypothetical protein
MGKKVFRYTNEEWWPVFAPDESDYRYARTAEVEEELLKRYLEAFNVFNAAYEEMQEVILTYKG